MRLLISAGEASGDLYGAQLIRALCARVSGLETFGLGGEHMRASACNTVVDARDIAVVGLAEVVTHLPRIYGEFRRLLRHVDQNRPDAAVLIDFPDFNLRLARQLDRRGVPVFYYVSPQLWAWRQGRIAHIRRYVRRMIVIFPFEEQFYRERGVEADYVGHPLADLAPPKGTRDNFAVQYGLDPTKPWIALLPGSRRKEVLLNLPEMLRAAAQMGPGYEYILPVALTLDREWLEQTLTADASKVRLCDDARRALVHSRAAVVASGTATVEAALLGTPFVMVYRVAPLTWALGRPLVRVPHFAMANLIAGREIVPELVQDRFTAENITCELGKLIPEGGPRSTMLAGLAEVQGKLRGSRQGTAAERAAEVVLNWI